MRKRIFIGLMICGFAGISFWAFNDSSPSSNLNSARVLSPVVLASSLKVATVEKDAPLLPTVKADPKPKFNEKLSVKSIPKTLERIRSSEFVNQVETEIDSKGVRSTLTVYKTDMKYSMVLLQEDWKKDKQGKDYLVGWRGMAADQLFIQGSVIQNSGLQTLLAKFSADLEETNIPGVYKVSFDGSDPMNLHELAGELSKTEGIKSADPNLIISIDN